MAWNSLHRWLSLRLAFRGSCCPCWKLRPIVSVPSMISDKRPAPPNSDVTVLGVLSAFLLSVGMATGFFAWLPSSVPNLEVQLMARQISAPCLVFGSIFFAVAILLHYWKRH